LMADLAELVNADFQDDLSCIFNDDNAEKLLLRIRIMNNELEKQGDDVGNTEDEVFLKRLEAQMLDNLALRGIADIKKVFIREANVMGVDPVTEAFGKTSEWMLDTEGVNLLEVMNQEEVDFRRTTSNHLIEVIQVLGIEAVRNTLLKELRGVIEFDGSYVNYRHLAILVEVMTYRGHLMSITRHGINRVETGPLMRCSFEETVDILMEAAAFAERDRMTGLSENIMLGQFCPLGTGEFGLHLNEEMLKEAVDLVRVPFPSLLRDYLLRTTHIASALFAHTSHGKTDLFLFPLSGLGGRVRRRGRGGGCYPRSGCYPRQRRGREHVPFLLALAEHGNGVAV